MSHAESGGPPPTLPASPRPATTNTYRRFTGSTDITEHPTSQEKLYLCAIKDCYCNKIVGYSIDSQMTSDLAASALRNAIALRAPVDTVCHSDRGSQFRSKKVVRI